MNINGENTLNYLLPALLRQEIEFSFSISALNSYYRKMLHMYVYTLHMYIYVFLLSKIWRTKRNDINPPFPYKILSARLIVYMYGYLINKKWKRKMR